MANDRPPTLGVTPQAIIGLVIIAYGLLLTADNLGWVESRSIFSYWPLALVALGFAMFARATDAGTRLSASFVLAAGGLLTGGKLLGWHVNLSLLWPLFIVGVGIVMISRAFGRDVGDATSEQQFSSFAFWSGSKRRVMSPLFKRADFTAVMGGIEVDLRSAAAAGGEAVIDVFVVMGGLEIRVPPDWVVSNQIVAVMAGVDDKSTGETTARNRLVLRGFVMMGGVEVKT